MDSEKNPKPKLFRDLSHSRQLLQSQKPKTISRSHSISSNPKFFAQKSKNLKNAEKAIKKSSSKEVIIQANLKKSHSLNEELGLIQKKQHNIEKNKMILVHQLKRDFEKNLINDETFDKERLTFFFRSRYSSLIKGLGFQKYYIINPKAKNQKVLIEFFYKIVYFATGK